MTKFIISCSYILLDHTKESDVRKILYVKNPMHLQLSSTEQNALYTLQTSTHFKFINDFSSIQLYVCSTKS